MPYTNADQFEIETIRQGVELSAPLTAALNDCGNDESLIAAVEHVGEGLRKTLRPLVDRPIKGEMWQGDAAATILQRMVNSTVAPVETGVEGLDFVCEGAKTISACGYAEKGFAKTIALLTRERC